MLITKIDIRKGKIVCYNEHENTQQTVLLSTEHDAFLNEFSNAQDLLTINNNVIVKRIMRFYGIGGDVPVSSGELLYADMTEAQKLIMDNFITIVTNAIP